MTPDAALLAAIAAQIREATGRRPVAGLRSAPVGGGSIHHTFRLTGGGESWFAKIGPLSCLELFRAEADGLSWLARQNAIVVPNVICCGRSDRHAWLVLEWLDLVPLGAQTSGNLGAGLAALHRLTAEVFGFDAPTFLGTTPQDNSWSEDWLAFWRDRRLLPQFELAGRRGAADLQQLGERLAEDLPALLAGHEPVPSLLHGDLWSGNAAATQAGRPAFFDPAPYFGDREADLAMTELFGGFGGAFAAAYRACWPLGEGYPLRRDLYNLYHLLNHFHLFGGGYGHQALAATQRLLAAAQERR